MTKKLIGWFILALCVLALLVAYPEPSLKAEGELDQFVYLPIVSNGPIKPPVPTPPPWPTSTPTPTPTVEPATPTPTSTTVPSTPTATATNTATPTSTPTNTPTSTPTNTPVPGPYEITLLTIPDSVPANGSSIMQLVAVVTDLNGVPVDGISVSFTATSGSFSNGLSTDYGYTNSGGIAYAWLTSSFTPGPVTLTVIAGDTTVTASVFFDVVSECTVRVPYSIDADAVWYSTCVYIADHGVRVEPGVTLTIEDDVVVEIGMYRHFRVLGTLHVMGTEANPVTMHGIGGANWVGLEINAPSASHNDLVYLNIENAVGGLNHIYGTIWATNITIDDWGTSSLPPIPTECEFEVPGSISVDAVWQSGCTYLVEGGTTVASGVSLTIPEGVTVLMGSWTIFNVNGTLTVDGTAEAPVVFRRRYEELSWAGLLFSGHDARGDLNYLVVDGTYCPLHVWPGFLRVSFQATHTVFNGWRPFGGR